MIRTRINFPKYPYISISIWAINGSKSQPIPVLEFNFNSQCLVVGYDIETVIFLFLVYNDAFLN